MPVRPVLVHRTVGARADFTQETLEVVGFKPVGGIGDALNTDSAGHASCACAGTVGVEVLVHFDGNVVGRIGESAEGIAVTRSQPS